MLEKFTGLQSHLAFFRVTKSPVKMTAPKKNCLIVLSSAIEGVSAQSFIQAFNLAKTVFNVQLTSPMARAVEYVQADDNTRRWLADFRTKSYSQPISLESIDASRYSALLIPNCPGAVSDLAQHKDLAHIVHHFVQEKKPICVIGLGVGALACAVDKEDNWMFKKYSMTAMSVYEVARSPIFGSMNIIPEDFIKDYGATYSCSEPGEVHIVVDRNLITGQNDSSTLIAVQNLILLSGQNRGEK